MKKSLVSIVRTKVKPKEKEIEEAVRGAIDLIGGLNGITSSGDLVLIKPNLLAVPSDPKSGATTSPEVCKAVAKMVKERKARPVIAESAAVGVDTEKVIKATGYDKLREEGIEVVDLKKTKVIKVKIPKGQVLEEVATYELVTQAKAIISVPVLKTHDQLEVTLSLKNLKGLLTDEYKRLLHRVGVVQGVVDITTVFKPALAVIDGIIGLEGLGPLYGYPVEMDLVVAGRDSVAIDSVASQIMGFNSQEVPITKAASERGLGIMNNEEITILGTSISDVQRRYLRSHEDKRVQVEEFSLIYNEGVCTGCRNTVLSALFDLKNAGQLEYLRGLTIMAGAGKLPQGVSKEKFIAVGICCDPEVKEFGKYVKGCPPNNIFVVQAVVGDKMMKRTYATEEDSE